MAEQQDRYFRNLSPHAARIGSSKSGIEVQLKGRNNDGEIDYVAVGPEIYNHLLFRRNIGVLVEEITEEQYEQLVSRGPRPTQPGERGRFDPLVNLPFKFENERGEEMEGGVVVERRESDNSVAFQMDGEGNIKTDSAEYTGADFVRSGRPDPGRGKSLSELRNKR